MPCHGLPVLDILNLFHQYDVEVGLWHQRHDSQPTPEQQMHMDERLASYDQFMARMERNRVLIDEAAARSPHLFRRHTPKPEPMVQGEQQPTPPPAAEPMVQGEQQPVPAPAAEPMVQGEQQQQLLLPQQQQQRAPTPKVSICVFSQWFSESLHFLESYKQPS